MAGAWHSWPSGREGAFTTQRGRAGEGGGGRREPEKCVPIG